MRIRAQRLTSTISTPRISARVRAISSALPLALVFRAVGAMAIDVRMRLRRPFAAVADSTLSAVARIRRRRSFTASSTSTALIAARRRLRRAIAYAASATMSVAGAVVGEAISASFVGSGAANIVSRLRRRRTWSVSTTSAFAIVARRRVRAAWSATASSAFVVAGGIVPSTYLRPDGVSTYLRPDGVSTYLRPV